MKSGHPFAIIFVVLRCLSSYTEAQSRILCGQSIEIKDSAHSVAIFYRSDYRCAGSLVSMKSVITLAKCVFGKKKTYLQVLAGVADIECYNKDIGQQRKVQEIFIDPVYDGLSLLMDVALVQVETEFQCEPDVVVPVRLYESELKPRMEIQVNGWGSDDVDVMYPNRYLHTTKMPIIEKDRCRNRFLWDYPPSTIICAEGYRSSLSYGDSGAGALVGKELCAVAHADENKFLFQGVFTDLTNERVRKFLGLHIS